MKSKISIVVSFVLISTLLLALLPTPARAAPGWYNTHWNYRKKITIVHDQVPSTLTNFPVVINETDPDLKDTLNGGHVEQSDGGDILFTASDGTTKLAHEIEKYTPTTGELVAWVKVPSLSAAIDTEIYVYYGNAGCADQWDISGTWESDYKMVQHFKESSGTYLDSSQFSNDGTPQGGVIQGTAGKIDGAAGFDGVDDYIASGNDTSLNITDGITIEALVKGEGANFSASNRATEGYWQPSPPQFQVVGDKIYYVWDEWLGENRISTGEMNTNGTNWTATPRTTGGYPANPQFQVVGDKIYYVWSDSSDGYYYQIWTGEMNTDGTAWAATLRTTSSYSKYEPQLQVVGDKIYYVWYEWDLDSNWQIWTGEMDTDGTGWAATQRTDISISHERYEPQLQVVGDKIYYVWVEYDGSYTQIWTGEMDTDGSDWSATQRTTSAYFKYGPQLQVAGGKIYYVWRERDSSLKWQIWTGEMNTGGTGWAATQRTTSAYDKESPQFQVVGSKIYYVWNEYDSSYQYEIWTGEMDTGGTGWAATKRTDSAYVKSGLQLQVVGTKIYYVWREQHGYYDNQIWTGEMGSNILNKGDFYGIGIMGTTVRGFINAGVDGFKYKGEAISDTAGAIVDYTLDTDWNVSDWNHVAVTYDQSALNLYINGNLAGSTAYSQAINTNDFELIIGDDFAGLIDEVHVIDGARSGDWKKTCANNEMNPAAFYSLGSEEQPEPGAHLKGVGGEVKPVDKPGLVIPWLVSALGIIIAGVVVRMVRRRVS